MGLKHLIKIKKFLKENKESFSKSEISRTLNINHDTTKNHLRKITVDLEEIKKCIK